jgi:hypothetical protein
MKFGKPEPSGYFVLRLGGGARRMAEPSRSRSFAGARVPPDDRHARNPKHQRESLILDVQREIRHFLRIEPRAKTTPLTMFHPSRKASSTSDTIKATSASPDGVYTATLFERDCGATTNFNQQVRLQKKDENSDGDSDVLFVIEGKPDVKLTWND